MSEYTPEMSEIREQYWVASGDPRRDSEAWGEFDRAMAAHDAEVARKTLEDAADEIEYMDWEMESPSIVLRARAASISTDKAGEAE